MPFSCTLCCTYCHSAVRGGIGRIAFLVSGPQQDDLVGDIVRHGAAVGLTGCWAKLGGLTAHLSCALGVRGARQGQLHATSVTQSVEIIPVGGAGACQFRRVQIDMAIRSLVDS